MSKLAGSFTHFRQFVLLVILCAGLALAACGTTPNPQPQAPTLIPFPTVTPGQVIRGSLNPVSGLRLDGSGISNPATAVAVASQPTATPDATACPALVESTALDTTINDPDGIAQEIIRFLSAGGTTSALENALRDDWQMLSESGFVRSDLDLTGEGRPEILMSYSVPGIGGTLLIAGCRDRRYVELYRSVSDEAQPPEIIVIGDMNRDGRNDLLYANRRCDPDTPNTCDYRTQLITWQPDRGRFVSLLGTIIISSDLPSVSDIDNDQVSEIIARQQNSGTLATGPLRTGVNIYDWNGAEYVLSIVQPDPPRYRIQAIHEGDRQFARREMLNATELYRLALTDESLRSWLNDEDDTLISYTLYRLLLAQTYAGSGDLLAIYQRIAETFPTPEQVTAYVEMSQVFWDTYQATADLTSACASVQAFIAGRPEAVSLLNRYGSRSPTYTARDLCPF